MFGEVGAPVRRLVRVRIGSLRLGDLAAGDVRPLTASEVRRLAASGRSTADAPAGTVVAPIRGRYARGDVRARQVHGSEPRPPRPSGASPSPSTAPPPAARAASGPRRPRRLGLRFVDTGLLYRAMTAARAPGGRPDRRRRRLVGLADRVTLADDGTGRLTRVLVDGTDATDESATRRWTPPCRRSRGARGPRRAAGAAAGAGGRAAGSSSRAGTSDGRAARRGPQGVPRRLGGGAGRAPDRGARPGPGRRRGGARPRAAPAPGRPRPQPCRGATPRRR